MQQAGLVVTVDSLNVAGLEEKTLSMKSAEIQFYSRAPFRQYSRKLGQYINSLQVSDTKVVRFEITPCCWCQIGPIPAGVDFLVEADRRDCPAHKRKAGEVLLGTFQTFENIFSQVENFE